MLMLVTGIVIGFLVSTAVFAGMARIETYYPKARARSPAGGNPPSAESACRRDRRPKPPKTA